MVDATTRTFFGNKILEIEPELVQSFPDFNDDAWMLVFHYPQSANRKLNRARHKLLGAFVKYMQSPDDAKNERA